MEGKDVDSLLDQPGEFLFISLPLRAPSLLPQTQENEEEPSSGLWSEWFRLIVKGSCLSLKVAHPKAPRCHLAQDAPLPQPLHSRAACALQSTGWALSGESMSQPRIRVEKTGNKHEITNSIKIATFPKQISLIL